MDRNEAAIAFTEELNNMMDKIYASRPLLLKHVVESCHAGDIENTIKAIDNFARTQQWLMNLGDNKGNILDDAIRSRKQKLYLNLVKNHCQKKSDHYLFTSLFQVPFLDIVH